MNAPVYEQMQQLIQKLRQADIAYYKHDAPVMSDLEYDRLMDELGRAGGKKRRDPVRIAHAARSR